MQRRQAAGAAEQGGGGGVDRKNQAGRPRARPCGPVLPAGISTLATSSVTLLPSPHPAPQLQCHGGAPAALFLPWRRCLCFPRSSSSGARRGTGSRRLGLRPRLGRGRALVRLRTVPLGSLENVPKGRWVHRAPSRALPGGAGLVWGRQW